MKNAILKSEFKSKLPDTETSIFSVMSKMAGEHNAINLSQGFPDFNCSDELTELVHYYQKQGFNQYAPMPGVLELRKEISEKTQKIHGRFYNPESQITITAGATQAIFTAISVIVNRGDEVIVFEPAYDSYVPAIKANGGIPVYIPLNKNDFSIDWDLTGRMISDRTKLVIINSPHNPAGSIISRNDLSSLEKIVSEKNLFIISDEVYEHITFDGYEHNSLSRSDKLAERSFIISSFGKTFHTTGWKTGYCMAPEFLMEEFRKLHQFVVFSVNTPIQYAYARFLKNESHYSELAEFYQAKRDYFQDHMRNSRFRLVSCKGTYFQLLDYSNISDLDDMEFCRRLTMNNGVALIPLSPFYKNGSDQKLVRACFAKRDEILLEAARLLTKV